MRLFLLAFTLSAFLTAASAFAQEKEPLTGGSPADKKLSPGWARFEPSPAHEYFVARAREDMAHRQSINRYYNMIGYDYGRPQINPGMYFIAYPAPRTRRYVASPGFFVDYQMSAGW